MDHEAEGIRKRKWLSKWVVRQFRISGLVVLFMFLAGCNLAWLFASPERNIKIAAMVVRATHAAVPVLVLCITASVCALLFWGDCSRLMRISMVTLSLFAVMGSVASLLDPIRGMFPVRSALLCRLLLFPIAQRADLIGTVALATAYLVLGLCLLQTRACPKPWAYFLLISAIWQIGSDLRMANLESHQATMDVIALGNQMASITLWTRIHRLLLSGFLLGGLGLTWKRDLELRPLQQSDGSLQLGVALLLMFFGAWESAYVGISSLMLLGIRDIFQVGMAAALPLVLMLVGLALPIAAFILLRRRERCLRELGYGRWRIGGLLLQEVAIFLIIRPAIPLFFPKPTPCPSPVHSLLSIICGPP